MSIKHYKHLTTTNYAGVTTKIKEARKSTKEETHGKKDHASHLWFAIHTLRREVIDDVLQGSISGRMPIKTLKRKAELIRKYSRRLKLLET